MGDICQPQSRLAYNAMKSASSYVPESKSRDVEWDFLIQQTFLSM